MKAIIKKVLTIVRKNKKPYEPDFEINFAALVKGLIYKKKKIKQPPKF